MKINIVVTGGMFDSQAGYSAWRFCQQAVTAGHSIVQVFFYQQGVYHGTQLAVPLADEFDAHGRWLVLAEQADIPLMVCVSASEHRGVLSAAQAQEHAKTASNLHPNFSVAGLASLHQASLLADRTVTFK
jgi:tRNA 2-thiouridine synthesizing protein D